MRLITALIRPFKLDEVREALSAIGVQSVTVSESKGFGRQYPGDFMPKAKLEVVIADALLVRAISIIQRAAQTGQMGDGKIFVSRIERAVRIRTGECDDGAL